MYSQITPTTILNHHRYISQVNFHILASMFAQIILLNEK